MLQLGVNKYFFRDLFRLPQKDWKLLEKGWKDKKNILKQGGVNIGHNTVTFRPHVVIITLLLLDNGNKPYNLVLIKYKNPILL